jgi:folate-dependent phosphoribosylglycinamide formyltransferase PurN
LIATPGDGDAMRAQLDAIGTDVLVLAGYLKLVPAGVVRAFAGRLLNIHPALLPAFGGAGMWGARIHQAVIAHGVTVTGVTVHFVDEAYDRGPILAQWPVPVLGGDTPQSLAARVLPVEHLLYPPCVEAVAAGRVGLDAEGRVRGTVGAIESVITDARFALAASTSFANELGAMFPR